MNARLLYSFGLAIFLCSLTQAQTNLYDEDGRLVQSIHPTGTAVLYEYDAADNIISVSTAEAPVAPTNLLAELESATAARVTWADQATLETGYRIERRSAFGYKWSVVAELDADVSSYLDTTLSEYGSYVYRIHALGNDGLRSAYSAEVAAAGAGSFTPFKLSKVTFAGESANNPLEVAFVSEAGVAYSVETSADLSADSWTAITFALSPDGQQSQTAIEGSGGALLIYLPVEDGPVFYRLVKVE
ncbi:hypothetical protein [Pelagicoccus sp. SDUM812003]|uniref:hypothetical protein n=1 Tax=Pelagicoccus sp. SDUM812003 TaxID=3041267 RepID=UPI00280CB13C|nr:hypothetical protein [Pelagicoccus sp. SDUM812003]MDQ8205101.1 hypothetical protein [Pelagicoccus sp. SDUM812003]